MPTLRSPARLVAFSLLQTCSDATMAASGGNV